MHWDSSTKIVTVANGTRYVPQTDGVTTLMQDTNGNQISFGGSITDTLGRVIPLPPTSNGSQVSGGVATSDFSHCTGQLPIAAAALWQVPGPNGGTATYKFCYANVQIFTNHTFNTNCSFNQCVQPNGPYLLLQSILLPDGQSAWTFDYSQPDSSGVNWADLVKITLPFGGTIAYSWSTATGCTVIYGPPGSTYRAIAQRAVNANDGTGGQNWTYSNPNVITGSTVTDPLGNDNVHTFTDLNSSCSLYETQTQYYNGSQATGTLLKTVATQYSYGLNPNTPGAVHPADNVVPISVTTTLPNGLVEQTSYSYDPGFQFIDAAQTGTYGGIYGKVLTEKGTDWGQGAPGPVLRETDTAYQFQSNSSYLNANMINSVTSVIVKDGTGNQFAKSTFGYDETFNNIAVQASGITTQLSSPPYAIRGNQTSVSKWLLSNNTAVTTHAIPFDTGEIYQAVDANGNVTTYSYDPVYAGGYQTMTCGPTTNNIAHCVSGTYDFNTGLLASFTGENATQQASGNTAGEQGHTTFYQYDAMSRLTSVTSPPDVSGNHPYTQYNYSAPNTLPFSVEKQQTIIGTTQDDSFSYLDGLGRPNKSVHSSAGNATVVTTYDAAGRVASVTNPYFTTSDSTYGSITYQYDGLARVTQTTKQDGSISTVQYDQASGNTNCVTATDEARKQRKSCSDGLGRVTSLWEDPAGLNYETDYQYDTLGNLLRVDQKGSAPTDSTQWRTRTFTYDSMSRLLTAHNPESGTISYGYDAAGNLLSKTAPSPNQAGTATTTTNYGYDALNRLTQKSYTDGVTPTVNLLYDTSFNWGVTQSNLIGRLAEIYVNSTNTTGNQIFSYDNLGRVTLNNQCTPSNCGSGNYSVTATYDLANNLMSLTYPSGRVVTYSYNSGNLLDQVQFTQWNGSAPSGGAYTYWSASDTTFYANGVPKSFTLGNGVTESTVLNKRFQLQEETVSNPAIYNFADHVYNYGTQNNGNVLSVTNQLNSSRTQTFGYDSLNRLNSATESRWGLAFVDDAWGNRLQQNLTAGSAGAIQITVDGNNHIQGAPANCTAANMYCYDAAGNLLHDNLNHQYVFDGENRITQVDSGATKYTYTSDGMRVRKDVSGSDSTEYLYFSGNIIAERDASTGDWTDYIWANGKRIARAQALDRGLRIYGTRCSSCGTQYSLFYLQNAGGLANYTIRSGDKLDLTQYQMTGSHGGIVLAFTDGTNTNWNLKDQDGYYANDDQTQTTTHVRRMDLSSFVGKTIQSAAFNQENDTAAGSFAIIYEQVVLISTDGTLTPIYTGQTSSPVSTIYATSGVTGTGTHVDVNHGKGIYPTTTTTYYHTNQINSSTLITAGSGWPVWEATYLPYGEEYNPQIGDEHYKFTGKEHDNESGLDYLGARYYGSTLGRFLTPDWAVKPIAVPYADFGDPQSLNLYSYVRNSPIARFDVDGHFLSGGAEQPTQGPCGQGTNSNCYDGKTYVTVNPDQTRTVTQGTQSTTTTKNKDENGNVVSTTTTTKTMTTVHLDRHGDVNDAGSTTITATKTIDGGGKVIGTSESTISSTLDEHNSQVSQMQNDAKSLLQMNVSDVIPKPLAPKVLDHFKINLLDVLDGFKAFVDGARDTANECEHGGYCNH
jgi:RHS repeat-associated protein